MVDNKSFKFALLVSILLHSVLFFGIPNTPFLPSKRALDSLTITYYKIKELPKKITVAKTLEPIARKLPKVTKEEILKPPKTSFKKAEKIKPSPKSIPASEEVTNKRFEKVVEEEQDDAKKATYISYYRAVRESIRQWADRNYPKNKRLAQGEVFLSFIVTSSGELIQVRVVDEKSSNNRFLRNIAINSIRDASPFPAFPKGMNNYQITFNVIISFESH